MSLYSCTCTRYPVPVRATRIEEEIARDLAAIFAIAHAGRSTDSAGESATASILPRHVGRLHRAIMPLLRATLAQPTLSMSFCRSSMCFCGLSVS